MKKIIFTLLILLHVMASAQQNGKTVHSELCILDMSSKEVSTVMKVDYHMEAPNWTPDGETLIFNSKGRLYSIAVGGGDVKLINSKFADHCNNDHVLSSDGKKIAVSHHTAADNASRIYILPVEGGTPELITPMGPSYLHGWSPDEKELAYCAERNGQYDVYTINIDTQEEVQLTNEPGLDDGPEYSPDGKYIYFNSTRSGTMQIWRMLCDGSEVTQMTLDEKNDWFAHPSPDNKWLVFVSYDPSVPAGSHPPNKHVMLRRIPVEGGEPEVLLKLFGGQGTINVPSWSPDSRKIAFVRYELH
jgi:TolB protein